MSSLSQDCPCVALVAMYSSVVSFFTFVASLTEHGRDGVGRLAVGESQNCTGGGELVSDPVFILLMM